MKYPRLDFARHTDTTLDIEETMLVQALHHSRGLRVMSEEDVKLAILSLYNTCKTQQAVIDELVVCVNELREPKKKPFWHFRK